MDWLQAFCMDAYSPLHPSPMSTSTPLSQTLLEMSQDDDRNKDTAALLRALSKKAEALEAREPKAMTDDHYNILKERMIEEHRKYGDKLRFGHWAEIAARKVVSHLRDMGFLAPLDRSRMIEEERRYSITHAAGILPPWGIEHTKLRFNSRGEAAAVCNELNAAWQSSKK